MHRRVIIAVSGLLFTLLSVLAVILTDVTDRRFPASLNATSSVYLDFSLSSMDDTQAFAALEKSSEELKLNMLKVAPDLSGGAEDKVYISVAPSHHPARPITVFNSNGKAEVRDSSALTSSYPSGEYLVAGSQSNIERFRSWLTRHNVESKWTENSLSTAVKILLFQSEFLIALVAAVVLLVGVVLYWLTALARGRALRILAGAPILRVQGEDLLGFMLPAGATAAVCGIGTMAAIGFHSGWVFVPVIARILLVLFGTILGLTATVALIMSWLSLPSPVTLAKRLPGVVALRKIATASKIVTFMLVIATASPAVAAYQQASTAAADQAQWRALSQQVNITFGSNLDETQFQRLKKKLGEVIKDAEKTKLVGLSYTWSAATLQQQFGVAFPSNVAIVNRKWLALMQRDPATNPELAPVVDTSSIQPIREALSPSMQIWRREANALSDPFQGIDFFRFHSDKSLPLAYGGSGALIFSRDALLLVVPDAYLTFNDSFLGSAMSSKNMVFEGTDTTRQLVQRHGLSRDVRVVNSAEDGVLRAQYTAYFSWLRGVSLAAIAVALLVSVGVSALITAILSAKRDLPLRLQGYSYLRIAVDRSYLEYGFIVAALMATMTLQSFSNWWAPLAVAVAALLAAPCAHVLATGWCIRKAIQRAL